MKPRPLFRPDSLAPVIDPIAARMFVSLLPKSEIIRELDRVSAPTEARTRVIAGWDALYTIGVLARELDRLEGSVAPATANPASRQDKTPLAADEAALALNITAHRVRQLVRDGALQRVDNPGSNRILIDPESVAQEVARRELGNEQFSGRDEKPALDKGEHCDELPKSA